MALNKPKCSTKTYKMGTRPKISEAKTLEQYRVTFENTESQPQIASTMAEYGYDPAKVAEGKALYETTLNLV